MSVTTLKKVTYAYATSSHAHRYNRNKGCWLVFCPNAASPVVFPDGDNSAKAKESALDFADSVRGDYDRYSHRRY